MVPPSRESEIANVRRGNGLGVEGQTSAAIEAMPSDALMSVEIAQHVSPRGSRCLVARIGHADALVVTNDAHTAVGQGAARAVGRGVVDDDYLGQTPRILDDRAQRAPQLGPFVVRRDDDRKTGRDHSMFPTRLATGALATVPSDSTDRRRRPPKRR